MRSSPSVDPPYPAYGGLFADEAIRLLQRFFAQENRKGVCHTFRTKMKCTEGLPAPEPKSKKGRVSNLEPMPISGENHMSSTC